MGQKLSGYDIGVMVGNYAVQFIEVTATIEDSSKAAMSRNRPNGYVRGGVTCSGEITLDTDNLNIMIEAAKKAGSWQEMELFDIVMNGETNSSNLNVELFECLTKISDLLNASANGEEKLQHKIPYEVTGKDFVRINGVPYAPESDKDGLI